MALTKKKKRMVRLAALFAIVALVMASLAPALSVIFAQQ
jgi:hypothetical protein